MKALIRLFRSNEEVINSKTIKHHEVTQIEESIRLFTKNNGCISEIYIQRYYKPVALYLSEEFFNKYNNIKIPIYYMGNLCLHIQFERINEDNSVCSCFTIDCDHQCGTLDCGCIDTCRCRDSRDY